jgi:Holliday junction resolvase-like predicted endonuclease
MHPPRTPTELDGICRHRLRLRPALRAAPGRAGAADPDRGRARLGARGEQLAAFHLVHHDGLEVIARNWRVVLDELRGELDVVARDPHDGTVVVCEVKTRRGAAARDGAVAALGPRQQARIRRMVGVLLATGELRARAVRFDLIALDLAATSSVPLAGIVPINALVLDRTELLARLAPLLQHVVPFVPRDAAGMPTDDVAKPGVEEQAYRWVSARAAQSLISQLPRIREGLARITCPVLLVTSTVDHTVDPTNGDAIAAALASASVERLACERSYHVPLIDYDAQLVEDRVVAFVAEVTGR